MHSDKTIREALEQAGALMGAIDANRRYPLDQAGKILGQSRAKTFLDIRRGKLSAIKDGKRTYIHGSELIRRSAVSDAPGRPITEMAQGAAS